MSSQLNYTEEQISDLKSRIMEINQSEEQTEKKRKRRRRKESNRSIASYKIKHVNLYIRGVPEAGERDKGIKKVFE